MELFLVDGANNHTAGKIEAIVEVVSCVTLKTENQLETRLPEGVHFFNSAECRAEGRKSRERRAGQGRTGPEE